MNCEEQAEFCRVTDCLTQIETKLLQSLKAFETKLENLENSVESLEKECQGFSQKIDEKYGNTSLN